MLLLVADCLFLVDKYMEFVNEQLAAHSSLKVGSLYARCTYNSKAIATVGKYYGVDFRKVVEHYFKFMPSTFGLVYLACLGNCHNLLACLYVGAVEIEHLVVAIFVLYGVAEQYGIDGDTRCGAALSIRTVVTKPIKFIGTGEKMEAIDVFHPARMADRILGMGDVVSLVERAQEQFDLEEAKKLEKKIRKNQFDFNDFYAQIQQIKKMGNIKDLASMIPGVGKAIRDVDIPEDAFKGVEAIIQSMTPKERSNPGILNTSRRQRIAKGSGTNIQEVNKLIKQFDQTRKMMQMMTGNKMASMMSRMKGMPGMPKMPGM